MDTVVYIHRMAADGFWSYILIVMRFIISLGGSRDAHAGVNYRESAFI